MRVPGPRPPRRPDGAPPQQRQRGPHLSRPRPAPPPRRGPTVSILVPIWRLQPELFRTCLDSIASQRHPPAAIEVVTCFDGTPGPEVEAASRALARSGLRNRTVAFAERHGMARARNACAEAAGGDWLLPLDHDDALTPDAVDQLLRDGGRGVDLVYSDYEQVDEGGRLLFRSRCSGYHALLREHGRRWDSPLLHSTFILQAQLIRADAFRRAGGFDPAAGLGHEVDLRLRLFTGANFAYVGRALYVYNRRLDSTYHTRYAELVSDTCMVLLRHLRAHNREVTGCCRLGKVGPAQVTHYGFHDHRCQRLAPAWVDYDAMRLRQV